MKFIHAVNFNGSTHIYIDAKKHHLDVVIDGNWLVISNLVSTVYSPIANVVSFERLDEVPVGLTIDAEVIVSNKRGYNRKL